MDPKSHIGGASENAWEGKKKRSLIDLFSFGENTDALLSDEKKEKKISLLGMKAPDIDKTLSTQGRSVREKIEHCDDCAIYAARADASQRVFVCPTCGRKHIKNTNGKWEVAENPNM